MTSVPDAPGSLYETATIILKWTMKWPLWFGSEVPPCLILSPLVVEQS